MVPTDSALKSQLLQEFHNSTSAGHGGILKTYKALSLWFYWPKMKQDIQEFISHCDICQSTKYETSKPGGLLRPLPIPTEPWKEITMDFIVQLPRSEGYSAIVLVVDRFTKVAHFASLKPGFTAKVMAQVFLQSMVKLHGFPNTIISDCDPIFMSHFWRNLLKYSGLLSVILQRTTHKLMVKPKSSTVVWNNTYGLSLTTILISGYTTFLGQSYVTTTLIIKLYSILPMRLYMDMLSVLSWLQSRVLFN